MKKILTLATECSGNTAWIFNCFTELGLRYYDPLYCGSNPLFKFKARLDNLMDEYEMNSSNPSSKGVSFGAPSAFNKSFFFRNDATFTQTHLLPNKEDVLDSKIIISIRDPRDNALSWFGLFSKTRNYDINEFYNYANNVAHHWVKYYETCLSYDSIKVIKFEDRKKDELACLKDILSFIEINFSEKDVQRAIDNSTFERAVEAENHAEKEYHDFKNGGRCTKSGKVGQYLLEQNKHHQAAFDLVLSVAGETMKKFGYV